MIATRPKQGETILVTGAAGFIGSHLVERLLEDGRRVLGFDNFDDYYDPGLKRNNIRAASDDPRFRLVEGDIRDAAAVGELFSSGEVGTVVHLAARAGVRPSIADPVLYTSVNLDGTTQLLEACRRHGVDRFVFGSSSSVYGNNSKIPFAENDPVDHPISPYAATKKAGEMLCYTYHHLFGLKVACLRFFTVFGPRQRPEMAIRRFATQLARGEEIEQYGDGSSERDYTYISDIIEGIVRALERCSGFDVWNLGGSRTTSLSRLIELLAQEMKVTPKIRRLPAQPGDVVRTWADVGKARRELGWSPEVPIEKGLARFVQWFMGQVKRQAVSERNA